MAKMDKEARDALARKANGTAGSPFSEWTPVVHAEVDGSQCALKFRDAVGYYIINGPCFLHDDGFWYVIEPPTQLTVKPTHFRVL